MHIKQMVKTSKRLMKRYAPALALVCLPLQAAATTTTVIDLGEFESAESSSFNGGDLVKKIDLGALPPGSVLRSVTMHYRLADGNPYLGDLSVLFADNSGDNGILEIRGNPNDGGYPKSAETTLSWNSGEDWSVGVTATQTLTPVDSLPAIDLNSYAVWLQTGYGGAWQGTITLEYDSTLYVRLDTPLDTQGYVTGTSISAAATVVEPTPPTGPYTVKFYTKLLPEGSLVEWSSGNVGLLFTADLGVLDPGDYEIYATLEDSATPTPGTATSATRTFTVAAAIPTTTALTSSANPSSYGQSVTFTATVSPAPTGGTVQFYDGVDPLGSPVLVNTGTGVATYSTPALGAATHAVTAAYSAHWLHVASTSDVLSQVVVKALLTVKAMNLLRAPNTANPEPLSYQITGYQNGETFATSGVEGTPLLSTDAVLSSPTGNYVITCALGSLAAPNYSFTFSDGTLTVAVLENIFSVNFYSYGGLNTEEERANVLMAPGMPAGMSGWYASGWLNVEAPWGGGLQAPVTLTSTKGNTATFTFKDCRNGGTYSGGPRNTLLVDGNGNMMDGHVNSTLLDDVPNHLFDMEVADITFPVYDVIFYLGANQAQFGDGKGAIVFNGVERGFTLKPGAFDGTFIEMVDENTEGNYIVFKNVTGSSFTAQTWGTGIVPGDERPGFVHVGPFGFQIKDATPKGTLISVY